MFVIAATPKFAAQSIRKAYEIGWRPMTFLSNVAVWISTVMEPAGVEAGIGILSTAYVKDPDDPSWKDDPGVKGWREFMSKYVPEADQHDTNYVNAYNSAMALEAVLKACGDDLSTENILRQAYAIKDLELPMLLPGIKVNTSPTDHVPVDQMQFMRFNGKSWERFGELLTGNRAFRPSGRREAANYDVQLHIGEFRDCGFACKHAPGVTLSSLSERAEMHVHDPLRRLGHLDGLRLAADEGEHGSLAVALHAADERDVDVDGLPRLGPRALDPESHDVFL